MDEPAREARGPGRKAVEQVVRELGPEQDSPIQTNSGSAVSVQVLTEPQITA